MTICKLCRRDMEVDEKGICSQCTWAGNYFFDQVIRDHRENAAEIADQAASIMNIIHRETGEFPDPRIVAIVSVMFMKGILNFEVIPLGGNNERTLH